MHFIYNDVSNCTNGFIWIVPIMYDLKYRGRHRWMNILCVKLSNSIYNRIKDIWNSDEIIIWNKTEICFLLFIDFIRWFSMFNWGFFNTKSEHKKWLPVNELIIHLMQYH